MTQWSPLLTVCRSFVLSEILNEYLVNGRYCERIMDLSSSLRPANYEPVTISQVARHGIVQTWAERRYGQFKVTVSTRPQKTE